MVIRQTWGSRLAWTFFGLNSQYIENVYEQLFQLKYYGGWSFFESYNLPVNIRVWFLERLVQQKKDEAQSYDKASGKSSQRGRSYKP